MKMEFALKLKFALSAILNIKSYTIIRIQYEGVIFILLICQSTDVTGVVALNNEKIKQLQVPSR